MPKKTTKRSLEDGRHNINYVTTGGAGYIAPINIEGLKSDVKESI